MRFVQEGRSQDQNSLGFPRAVGTSKADWLVGNMGIHVGLVLALGSQKLWEDRSRLLTSDIANFM